MAAIAMAQDPLSLAGVALADVGEAQHELALLFQELAVALESTPDESPGVGDQDQEDVRRTQRASLLFVARGMVGMKGKAVNLPVAKLLAMCGCNLLEFFRETTLVLGRLSSWFESHGSSVAEFTSATHLKENSDTVVVLGLLAKKYKDYFNLSLHQLDYYKQVVLRLGWLLFIVLKHKLLSRFPDLISCMELLPCVFHLLVSNSPKQPDFVKSASPERAADTLRMLSDFCKTDYGRVTALMASVELVAIPIFTGAVADWRQTSTTSASRSGADGAAAVKHEDGADASAANGAPSSASGSPSGADAAAAAAAAAAGPAPSAPPAMRFEGLVTDNERMNCAIAALEREYEAIFERQGCELDERDFLSMDFNKMASPRFSPNALHAHGLQMGGGSKALIKPGALLGPGAHTTVSPSHANFSPSANPFSMGLGMGLGNPGLHSPLPIMALGQPGQLTPVTEAMACATWLRATTAPLAPEAPPSLAARIAASCDRAVGDVIAKRARDMVAAVFPDDTGAAAQAPFPLVIMPSLASERRTEALKLYYHVLDVIVSAGGAPPAVLSSAKFHRGLMALVCEVVGACYRMVTNTFPRTAEVLKIRAFDLGKMLHNFVRHIPTLPRELKRHLFTMEERIIEQLAWEVGSPLYVHIVSHAHEREGSPAAPTPNAMPQQQQHQPGANGGLQSSSQPLPLSQSQASNDAPAVTGAAAPSADQHHAPDGAAESQPAQRASSSPDHQLAATAGGPSSAGPAPMDTNSTPNANAGAAGVVVHSTSTSTLPSPSKRPAPSSGMASFSGLVSPAKKARGEEGVAIATTNGNGAAAGAAQQHASLFTEPLPVAVGPPPAALLAGPLAGAGGIAGVSQNALVLYDFLRKLLKVVAFRLALLCENFDFSPLSKAEVNQRVYEAVEYAVYHQTSLFYNRHIDQITLSALYGFCKVAKLNQVSFKEIITQYRKQPQANQQVFRAVIIEQTNPGLQVGLREDIISFYNKVFVPSMKAFLLKAGEVGAAAAAMGVAGLPPLPPKAPLLSMSPGRRSAGAAAPRSTPSAFRSPPPLPPSAGGGGLPLMAGGTGMSLSQAGGSTPLMLIPPGTAILGGAAMSGANSFGAAGSGGLASAPAGGARGGNGGSGGIKGGNGRGSAAGSPRSSSGGAPSAAAAGGAAGGNANGQAIPDGLAALLMALDNNTNAKAEPGGGEDTAMG